MSKVRNPLLSFSASGTIAETLTFTRSPAGPRAQAIPTHPDARTLPQSYQRWKFRDAQFAWNALTPAQQAAHNAARYPPHMTGQQRHTRQYLRALTDLAFWLPLDEPLGQSLKDISRNANHGTATGTLAAPGIIDQARLFDATDDTVRIPHHSSLNTGTGNFTLTAWVRPTSGGTLHSKYGGVPLAGFWHYIYDGAPPWSELYLQPNPGNPTRVNFLANPFDGHWHHHAIVINFASHWDLYLDAVHQGLADISHQPNSTDSTPDYLLSQAGPWYGGLVDDIRFYTRALSPAHLAYIHSQERYPVPA